MMRSRIFRKLAAVLAVCCLASGCARSGPAAQTQPSTGPQVTQAPAETEPATEEATQPPVPRHLLLLQEMTLEEKVGQLFIVFPEALKLPEIKVPLSRLPQDAPANMTNQITGILKQYPVGGLIFFQKNIFSPEQLSFYLPLLQKCSRIPLFLSVDEEGGDVARLANHSAFDLPRFSHAGDIGATGDPAYARVMGNAIGEYLRFYGFNMDFAPVADVNTNPRNPVIGSRAFSSDPETAALMADAMAQGLEAQGVIPVYKHFPGHGDTAQDSHTGIAVSYRTMEELNDCELLPFRQAGSDRCIMAGHIALPEVTGDLTPATLSPQIITGILREQLGFQGLVITDSLMMGAITDRYSSGEAAVAALEAGCDLLLLPKDFPGAYRAVLQAVKSGKFPEAALDERVGRILAFKLRVLEPEFSRS